jgi:hypothetical protein
MTRPTSRSASAIRTTRSGFVATRWPLVCMKIGYVAIKVSCLALRRVEIEAGRANSLTQGEPRTLLEAAVHPHPASHVD